MGSRGGGEARREENVRKYKKGRRVRKGMQRGGEGGESERAGGEAGEPPVNVRLV